MNKKLARLASAVALAAASLSAHATFNISINYTGDSQYQSYFNSAESFWENIITGYQPGISLTGFAIAANIEYIDGAYGTLGSAGPTSGVWQGGYALTTAGSMRFDSADMATMAANGSLGDVIRHEMGHVIGIGTWWSTNNLYVVGSGRYTGANGLAMYRTEFNQPGATYIPVELGGGAGTAGGHWNEVDGGWSLTGFVDSQGRDMRNELMTGWLDAPTFTSKTTVASLQDIGYTVNISAVPEPESALLFAFGLPVLAGLARRRKKAAA